jgi:hypothetical protein
LKDTVISGSLRVTDTILATTYQGARKVLASTPTASGTHGYFTFTSASGGDALDLYSSDRVYLYDACANDTITSSYFNIGKELVRGGITLHSSTNATAMGNLVPATITANTT